ncbi:GNAT family N-acetyltransferase [Acidimangrovimonas sediminis]|uniref:GNAT family N-acetyltransferase n=1 Tax=Acidimangrovimonas sediminis TaxID=2056283 RepID=UPI000C8086CA|nr:GNAT family N-acetyltransferase [Acidimangrovimonas sediminis]
MTQTHVTLRPAIPADLPGLLALYAYLTPGDPPADPAAAKDAFDRLGAYPGSAIYLCLDEDQPVAACTLIVVPNLTRGAAPFALIENVVTHGAWRRQGLGRRVLAAATQAAWQAGCYKVMLLAGSTDPAVMAFYRGAGFAQSKTGFQIRRPA